MPAILRSEMKRADWWLVDRFSYNNDITLSQSHSARQARSRHSKSLTEGKENWAVNVLQPDYGRPGPHNSQLGGAGALPVIGEP